MPHLKITINNDTVMDGDLGEWTSNPPEILTDQLKANAKPAPWMRALMLTIAHAAMTSQPTHINVQTLDNNWTLEVSAETP